MRLLGVMIQNDGNVTHDVGSRALSAAHRSLIMNFCSGLKNTFRKVKRERVAGEVSLRFRLSTLLGKFKINWEIS